MRQHGRWRQKKDPRPPYWTRLGHDHHCSRCKRFLAAGSRVFFFPDLIGTRSGAYCEKADCGPTVSMEFKFTGQGQEAGEQR